MSTSSRPIGALSVLAGPRRRLRARGAGRCFTPGTPAQTASIQPPTLAFAAMATRPGGGGPRVQPWKRKSRHGSTSDPMALLEVQNLQTHFRTPEGINRAVDGVSFHVTEGETLAIVGESGCGKSVTAMSLMRLIPEPPGKIAGSVRFQAKDLLQLSEREMRTIRGNDISMIFQEPK